MIFTHRGMSEALSFDEGAFRFLQLTPKQIRTSHVTLDLEVCSLLGGVLVSRLTFYHHGDTENSENALRQSRVRKLLLSNLS